MGHRGLPVHPSLLVCFRRHHKSLLSGDSTGVYARGHSWVSDSQKGISDEAMSESVSI